jgi:AcrR family transcriptional regulator
VRRVDSSQVRARILAAALPLFAGQGYAATPVRAIVQAAGVNLAAIAYYFGDKAGLYRAVLDGPAEAIASDDPPFDAPGIPLDEAMRRYMRARLLPLGAGPGILLHVRLRLREIVEPTGMLDECPRDEARQRLADWLARTLQRPPMDADLQRLAFAIFSLITCPYISHDQIRRVEPALFDAPGAIDAWIAQLAAYATAMVDVQRTHPPFVHQSN